MAKAAESPSLWTAGSELAAPPVPVAEAEPIAVPTPVATRVPAAVPVAELVPTAVPSPGEPPVLVEAPVLRLDGPVGMATPEPVPVVAAPERGLDAGRAPRAAEEIALRLAVPSRLAQWRDELVAWFKTLASAAVYATLIVTFGFQVARVEGQSMAPTLADQDRLIVNKLIYRITAPRRSDIVMLYYPLNPEKSFVKRVIAEEGDTVRIVDGRVYVNDVPVHDEYVPPAFRSHEDWGPQVISEGYYFVMGDHRNNSSDSRHWGLVPKKYIIGKVQLRWWPLPSARLF